MIRRIVLFVICCSVWIANGWSQNLAIGERKSHLAYNSPICVVDAGDIVYCANASSLFSFYKTNNSYERLRTTTGFSDVGIRDIFFDEPKSTLVISYTNSNVDFLINGGIFNFSSIKSSDVSGDKNVYGASFYGDTVILSCGFGI